MKYYHANFVTKEYQKIMDTGNSKKRLISYYFLRELKTNDHIFRLNGKEIGRRKRE